MRMWEINPELLCRQLLGEHKEVHMLAGSISKGKSINGYLSKRLVNPRRIKTRDHELAEEMTRRGYNHKSPMDIDCSNFTDNPVSIPHNRAELIRRCPGCAERILQKEG